MVALEREDAKRDALLALLSRPNPPDIGERRPPTVTAPAKPDRVAEAQHLRLVRAWCAHQWMERER